MQEPASIVICCHTMQRWDDIAEAVESLRQQTVRPAEIILVVDHNDELRAYATDKLPDVRVVANHEERGLSGGRNTGIKVSTGNYVGFLDDDAVADPRWLEYLLNACRLDAVLGATSRIVPRWIGERPDWFPEEFLWTVGCTYRGQQPAEGNRVRNLIGASMLMKRGVFDRAGGFSHVFARTENGLFVSCDETEFCIRAESKIPGGYFVIAPEAKVEHKVPAARLTWGYYRRRCVAEGRSKAFLATLTAQGALGTERDYVRTILLSGFLRGIGSLRPTGLKRAAAIAYGLGTTAYGYGCGKMRHSGRTHLSETAGSAI